MRPKRKKAMQETMLRTCSPRKSWKMLPKSEPRVCMRERPNKTEMKRTRLFIFAVKITTIRKVLSPNSARPVKRKADEIPVQNFPRPVWVECSSGIAGVDSGTLTSGTEAIGSAYAWNYASRKACNSMRYFLY